MNKEQKIEHSDAEERKRKMSEKHKRNKERGRDKALDNLKRRQADFDRTVSGRPGFHRPGSMNQRNG